MGIFSWLFSGWSELREKDVPRWVRRKADAFYDRRGVRPYNKRRYYKGKTYIYKVWFEMIGQGQIKTHYYRKIR